MKEKKINILHIEDNSLDARLIEELLKEVLFFEYKIFVAETIQRGLEYLKANQTDIILLDLNLPDSRGEKTFETIFNQYKEIPIILVSGLEDEELSINLIHLGAQDYITKSKLDTRILERSIMYSLERSMLRNSLEEELKNRVKAEESLRVSELRFKQVSENASEWIWEVDNNGLYTYASPVIKEVLGYEPEELIGRKYFYDFFPPGERENIKKSAFEAFARKAVFKDFVNVNLHKEGREIILSTSGVPMLDGNGNLTGYRGVDIDITERKGAEEELLKAKNKAEESDRLKSAFLANVSHEIRTPLNAIVGFSAMFSDPDLSMEDRIHFSEIIKSRSDTLLYVIDAILEISRIESGNAMVIKRQTVINDILEDLDLGFRQKLRLNKKTNLQLVCEKALAGGQLRINTDEDMVKRVFFNLIENAIKFTESGTITFGYKIPENGVLTCYVSDTGIGISAENHELIFEHFRQVESDTQKKLYGGTGLGLSICRGSLALLGGKIWVESVPGEGSTFWFTLPIERETGDVRRGTWDVGRETRDVGRETRDVGYHWPGKKLLIVEDEESNIEFLKVILNPTEAELVCAENGRELRDLYSTLGTFDLVLLDIRLPDTNGWELAKEIKTIRPDLPVITQTAYAMASDQQKSAEVGCDDYISKPINRDLLLKKISASFR